MTLPDAAEGVAFQQTIFHFCDANSNVPITNYEAVVTLGNGGDPVTITSTPGPYGQIVLHNTSAGASDGYDVVLNYTYTSATPAAGATFGVVVTDTVNLDSTSASVNDFMVHPGPTLTWEGGTSGSWTGANWGDNGENGLAWIPGSFAIFPATSTPAAISLGGVVSLAGMQFQGGNYTLSGGSLSFVSPQSEVDVNSGAVTINSTFTQAGLSFVGGSAGASVEITSSLNIIALSLTDIQLQLAAPTATSSVLAGLNVGSDATFEIEDDLTAGSLENDGAITADSDAVFGFASDGGSSGSIEVQGGGKLVMGSNYGGPVVVDDGATVAFNCSATISTTFTLPGAGTATFELAGNAVTITSLQSDLGGGSYDSNNIDGTVTFTDSVGGGIFYLACGGNAVNGTINIHGVTLDTTDSMTLNGTGVVNIGSGATFEVDGSMSVEGGTVNNNGVFNLTGFMEIDSGLLNNTTTSQTNIFGTLTEIYAGSGGSYAAGTTTVEPGGELYVYESVWTLDLSGDSGTLTVLSGGVVYDVGAMWTDVVNDGYFNIIDGDLQVNDSFYNLAAAMLTINGGSLENYGTFYNYGSVNAINGNFNNYGTVYNYAGYGAFYASSANFNYNEFGTYIGTAIDWY